MEFQMGYYIDPEDMSKEAWLEQHGELLPDEEFDIQGDPKFSRYQINGREYGVVCLIDNGWMTAAGIAYDDRELAVFAQP